MIQRLTHIAKLHHPDLAEFTNAAVGSLRLEEELGQGHLFTSKEFPHDDAGDLQRQTQAGRDSLKKNKQ